jgi:disulfide bond formation protein DsbB
VIGRISPKSFLLLMCWICIISLCIAYTFEYAFGIKPCTLCLYQRYIFMAIIALNVWVVSCTKPRMWRKAILITGLSFFLNAGVAGYQVLVEQKILEVPSVCRTPAIKAQTVEELRAQLRKVKTVPCDEVTWSWFGLSMAAYNLVWCLMLAVTCAIAYKRISIRRFGSR